MGYKLIDWWEFEENLNHNKNMATDLKKEMMSSQDYQNKYGKKDLSKYDYIIGIDAGVENGIITYETEDNNYTNQDTLNFWNLVKVIDIMKEFEKENCLNQNHLFIIENPNLNKPTFKRPGQSAQAMQKIAQNVGSNKRTAQLIIEYCQLNNIDYVEVKPVSKKWDSKTFQERTGIKSSVSQHVRDAGKLIWEYIN